MIVLILWCFRVCWDLQVSIRLVRYTLVFSAQKSFYACCLVQGAVGTWILLPCWRSIHLPFYTLAVIDTGLLLIFFVTWFRARTRVRWVAPVISRFLLWLIKVDPLGLFYINVSPFRLYLDQVLCPPVFVSLFLFIIFSSWLKKNNNNIFVLNLCLSQLHTCIVYHHDKSQILGYHSSIVILLRAYILLTLNLFETCR